MQSFPWLRARLIGFALCGSLSSVAAAADPAPASTVGSEADRGGSQSQKDCMQTFEEGQKLFSKRELKAATERFISCSQPTCPNVIAQECTRLYSEAEKLRPTVTLVAKDKDQQLIDARVSMDGELLAERLDGRAIPIDPGLHEFKFEVLGRPPLVIQALVAEAEKNKLLVAEFASPESPASPASSPAIPPPSSALPRPATAHTTPVSVYVLGGVGLAALIGGTTFRVLADKDFRDLEDSCKPNCTDDDKSPVMTKYVVSTTAFGVGAAALVSAGVIYFATRSSSSQETGLVIAPTLGSTGAVGSWTGRF